MPIRIREAIDRLYRKHPRAVAWAEGWLLLLLVVGGCLAIGMQVGQARADVQVARMSAAQRAEVQRLADINRQLMLIIEARLPDITAKTDDAAEKAGAAADAAARAAVTAQAAAKSAHAAGTARDAATTLNEALEPQQPAPPANAPEWLDTP